MNEILVLVLTAVIAVATTVYSVRLFRASQAVKEIARQAALLQRWERMLEHSRRHGDAPAAESRLYGGFADTLIQFIVTELLDEVRTSLTPAAVAFRGQIRARRQ